MKNSIALFLLMLPSLVMAESICDTLKKEDIQRAEKLASEIKVYDCCNDTISNCLKKEKVCRLARRLKEEICLLIREKVKDQNIKDEISNRAKSMNAQIKTPKVELDEQYMAGDKDSKITVVSYICARCPFCAIITPKLYKEITEGRLKGKAKLYIRPFPLKSHEHSLEGGLAMVAAAKMGKFFDYLIRLQEDFNNFSLPKLNVYAAEVGLTITKFEETMKDHDIKKYLENSKKEGLKNGVDATPTFFINGKIYYSNFYIYLLVDSILEEYDIFTQSEYEK